MIQPYRVSIATLQETFAHFRTCGRGCRECQVVWVSRWSEAEAITRAVHPRHRAHVGSFAVDNEWLTDFWKDLSRTETGVRVQVHTHPGAAFHSAVDDAYPMVPSAGFLSLVIPNFGCGAVGFDDSYLAELQLDGTWRQVPIVDRIAVV